MFGVKVSIYLLGAPFEKLARIRGARLGRERGPNCSCFWLFIFELSHKLFVCLFCSDDDVEMTRPIHLHANKRQTPRRPALVLGV